MMQEQTTVVELPYTDASILPTKDGKYSLIQRVGSMSPQLKESIVLFRKGRWPKFDWHRPVAWRELYQSEKEKYGEGV